MSNKSIQGPSKLSNFLNRAILCGILSLTMSSTAWAHERNYVFNQEYKTLPQGGMELESHTRFKMPNTHRSYRNTWTYKGEIEYGVTDHLTLAHSELWKTENRKGDADATQYRGFEFEAKYRIGEKGKYWVDPLIYVEWATDPQEEDNPNAIESKLVLSKDYKKINAVYNQIMESKLGEGGRTEQKFSAGLNYAFFESFQAGMEIKGDYWLPSGENNTFSLGPVLSLQTQYFWVAMGAAWGLNKSADDIEARLIIGVPLL